MRVEDFVNASMEHFDGQDNKGKWDPKFVSKKRKEWILQATQEFPGVSKIIRAVEEIVPQNTIIYSDMTQFAYLAKEIWDMKKPNHWHHPYGFGTLGVFFSCTEGYIHHTLSWEVNTSGISHSG